MIANILIIDDSEDDQRLYWHALKDFGCSLEMASSAEAGLARIAASRPDLILLDYNLPDMDGLGFIKRLAEDATSPIPIIMLTGEDSVEVAVEVMKQGADDYLVKDLQGRYLRLLPSVARQVLAAHDQRNHAQQLQKLNREMLQRNQTLMHNAMDGIHVMNMQGNIVEANDAFCTMLGYTREEMLKLNVADWDAQWSAEQLQERFKWLIATSTRFETVHRRKDGVLINVEVSTSGMEINGQHFLFAASRDITKRKRAEEELKLNAQVLDSISDSVFLFDFDGNFIYLNEAAWKSRGYTRDELMAMNVRDLNPPEFRDLIAARAKEVRENGHGRFDSAHYCKDGSIMPIEINCRVIEDGGRQLLLSTVRDITERRKVEAVLRQHKQMIDTSIDGFVVADMQGNLLEVNEAYARLSGYTVEELMGMHISQLEAMEVSKEDVAAHIATVVKQGYDRFETRHRHKDGHEIDVEVSVTHMTDPQRLIIFCHDITQRKKVQLALIKSETNMRAMMDNSPYLTWMKDRDGRYIKINRVFADYLRLTDADQATGKTDLDLQPRELALKYRADDAQVMASRAQKHVEEEAFDGSTTHWVETYKTPIIDAQGSVMGTVGFARDITARKQAERTIKEAMHELEKKELAKTRFLAAAGHDLRQPLAAANLYIDTLRRGAPTPDQIEVISRLGQVMDTFKVLLDALLNISKLEAGAIKPEYTSINVPELIIWLEENFASVAAEKQLDFRLFFPIKETFFVRSDVGLINSVLMNLVSNAIKFTSTGGVLVSARRRGDQVLIQVWDTGIGIPDDHMHHIFDEFYQVNNPQRDRTSGLGLGLAIVERALALLGIPIECHSQSGRGSVFGFRLPLDATSGVIAQQGVRGVLDAGAHDLFAKGKRFVIVEDDVLVAEALYKALVVMGGEVTCFHNAEDAILHPSTEHADYHVVDYMLGGSFNGIQYLNQLREKLGRPIKAVLMTGETSSSFVSGVKDCDWPVLHKPVNISQLFSSLAKHE